MIQTKIECPKFGGNRPAATCCVDDRFRFCRKKCKPLAEVVEKFPELPKIALEYFMNKIEVNPSQWSYLRTNFANRNLPKKINPDLKCPKCKFVALSVRGLKSHMTRNHPSGKKKKVV